MSKRPWMKFYPNDWRGEPRLRMCSLAARGLWMDIISYMHESTPYGHLTIEGVAPDDRGIAALVSRPLAEVRRALGELEQRQVFSRNAAGVIFSRRMVRDAEKAERDSRNGGRGGNPKLVGDLFGGVNPPDNPPVKAQMPETRIQKEDAAAGDARARGIAEQAQVLADDIALLCGHNLQFLPPAWCGAPMRVDAWLTRGWQRDVILVAVNRKLAQLKRSGGRPVESVKFFETAITDEMARQGQPLPNVVDLTAAKVEIFNGPDRSGASHGYGASGKSHSAFARDFALRAAAADGRGGG